MKKSFFAFILLVSFTTLIATTSCTLHEIKDQELLDILDQAPLEPEPETLQELFGKLLPGQQERIPDWAERTQVPDGYVYSWTKHEVDDGLRTLLEESEVGKQTPSEVLEKTTVEHYTRFATHEFERNLCVPTEEFEDEKCVRRIKWTFLLFRENPADGPRPMGGSDAYDFLVSMNIEKEHFTMLNLTLFTIRDIVYHAMAIPNEKPADEIVSETDFSDLLTVPQEKIENVIHVLARHDYVAYQDAIRLLHAVIDLRNLRRGHNTWVGDHEFNAQIIEKLGARTLSIVEHGQVR